MKTDNTVLSNGILENDIFFPKKNLPSGTLRIVLTTDCNFDCIYCFAEGEKDKHHRVVDLEKLKKVLIVAKEFGITNIKLSGGEPLLYPRLEELLAFLKETGFIYVDLTTNISQLDAHKVELLNKYDVTAITLSLNTMEANAFKKLSNFNDFQVIHDNLNNTILYFKGSIRINCIIFDTFEYGNYEEIINFCKINKIGLRLIEPSKVENHPITEGKEKFYEVIDSLKSKATKYVLSKCSSVEYLFFDSWYITVMHSLCDNKLCKACVDYMYIRYTTTEKLKPCLAREDTEVEIDFTNASTIRSSFIKAIAYMGVGIDET